MRRSSPHSVSDGPYGRVPTPGAGLISGIFFQFFVPNAVNLTIVGILIVALAIPRRFFIDYLGWLGIPVVMVILELLHPPHWQRRNIDYTLSLLWIFEVGLLIVTAILLKMIVSLAWAKWRGEPVFAEFARQPGRIHGPQRRALIFCWGLVAAFLAYLTFRVMLGEVLDAVPTHVIVLGFVAALWIVPRILAARMQGDRFRTARVLLVSFRWSMLGFLVLGAGMSGLVVRKAAELAGDEPYCLQVPSGRSPYRQAGTLLDLSALTMKGQFSRFHALLVLGDPASSRVYNWSYRQLGFDDLLGPRNRGEIQLLLNCEPRTDFAARLPLVIPEVSGWTPVYFAGRQYRIPSEFQPRSDGIYARHLIISATAPDFRARADGPDSGPNVLHGLVFVYLRSHTIESWVELNDDEEIVSEENWAGLVKQTISHSRPYPNWVRFVARDSEGAHQAVISGCRPEAESSSLCQHRFQSGELFITFYHSPDDLADWKSLQERLLALFDSFSTEGTADELPR